MRDAVEAAGEQAQYLSFRIDGIDYAVPILKVREILQHEEITRVPGTPPSVRGVLNVRGAVVPVVDLAVKFGGSASRPGRFTCVLVVEVEVAGGSLTLGVLADAVNEVVALRPDEIEPSPSFGTGVSVEYLVGMGKVGRGFVLLLDIDRVLAAGDPEPEHAADPAPEGQGDAPADAAEQPEAAAVEAAAAAAPPA
ncbi:chemotaxis protein CheW [Anaeromyxobacter sp. PSR-1]|uniref:chemotaxis protein CheW n=1 Tax=Anaeromyxobacter sp. PSR-1 TaxID=1300915 RepID=UPI0005E604AF|nr:chemotaxis protein CheW [Anaeromyxobacter sp. PSR-1]GAO02108.1 chemotaxis protein CheW [Anaeromyxobacter sp. PSR-1]